MADASIYNMIRPAAQAVDPMESYGKALTIRGLMGQQELQNMQRQQLVRSIADDDATAQAYRTAGGDSAKVRDLLYGQGLYKPGIALDKAISERRKEDATTKKTEIETFGLAAKQLRDLTASVQDDAGMAMLRESATRLFGPDIASKMAIPDRFDPVWKNAQIQSADKLLDSIEKGKDRNLRAVNEPFTVGPDGKPVANVPVQQFQTTKAKAGASSQNVVNVGEKEESKVLGKIRAEAYGDILRASQAAYAGNGQIAMLRRLGDNVGTGKLTPLATEVGALFSALGLTESLVKNMTGKSIDQIGDAQSFQAIASDLVLQKQIAQKGPQTESDAKRMEMTIGNLKNTPRANQFTLDAAEAQNNKIIRQRQFADQYRKSKGSLDGVDEAWAQADGSKSIFDEPAMRKWADPQANPQSSATGNRVRTQSDIRSQADKILNGNR